MKIPNQYIFIRKDVKHARIRVSEDGSVRFIVPHSFSEDDISALIQKKASWIAKQEAFFTKMSKIALQRNQLLLYGNRYSYYYDPTFEHKVVVDHQHRTIRAKRDLLNPELQEAWYKTVAKRYLTQRTELLSESLKMDYQKLFIRDQRTKWGNCTRDKNISLNWRLIKAPMMVIDYLIVHELVHTRIMNHSYKYWTMLKSCYPDYKEAIKWLDQYGNSL